MLILSLPSNLCLFCSRRQRHQPRRLLSSWSASTRTMAPRLPSIRNWSRCPVALSKLPQIHLSTRDTNSLDSPRQLLSRRRRHPKRPPRLQLLNVQWRPLQLQQLNVPWIGPINSLQFPLDSLDSQLRQLRPLIVHLSPLSSTPSQVLLHLQLDPKNPSTSSTSTARCTTPSDQWSTRDQIVPSLSRCHRTCRRLRRDSTCLNSNHNLWFAWNQNQLLHRS